jgi:hypothetical protein
MVQSVTLECESSAVCPHPGVPVHGFGVVLGDDRPILPIIRQFSVGESLNFFCSKVRGKVLMKESQGDANVALLTSDAAIIANCPKTENLLFMQTFSCEKFIARNLNSIQIRSAVPISSVAILVHSG